MVRDALRVAVFLGTQVSGAWFMCNMQFVDSLSELHGQETESSWGTGLSPRRQTRYSVELHP